jgi:glucose/arabinose dehydrogenase
MVGGRPWRRAAVRVAGAGVCLMLTVVGVLAGCTSYHDHEKARARTSMGPSRVPEPSNFSPGPIDPSSRGDASVSVTTLVRNLDIPWGVTFLPDGGALVTERNSRRILKVGPQRQANGELVTTTVATIGEANPNGEGGLLGIAASPDFAKDQTVFVYYSTTVDNRIAQLRLGGRPQPIVTGIPLEGIHDGGRVAFGPDGFLYASTGDASRSEDAQRLDSLGGKILRMTTNGQPAPHNPFANSLVWSYGHRNPEGITWDRAGRMYVAEIGESLWDELNVIEPGGNYGWPRVEGIGNDPRYRDPIVEWHPEAGVSADVAIVDDVAVVTCLRGQRIYLVRLDGNRVGSIGNSRTEGGEQDSPNMRWRPDAGVVGRPEEALVGRYGRLRTAITAPDGSIWLTTSNRDGRNDKGPAPDDDRILQLTLRPRASVSGH